MDGQSLNDSVWDDLWREAEAVAITNPLLSKFVQSAIFDASGVVPATARILSDRLATDAVDRVDLRDALTEALLPLVSALVSDARAYLKRDSACHTLLTPFLFYKGFHATATYRAANVMWHYGRRETAMWLQNRMTEVFAIDIHPAAQIDQGLMIDHGTGVVIGETTIIGKDVSLMQGVTLGGTGKETHNRHPIIRDNVLVSSGVKVLGRIEIGTGAKIGAGSVVLNNIPAHCTAVGIPATAVGHPRSKTPSLDMDHTLKDDVPSQRQGT